MHFRAGTRGILLLQQSAPVSTYAAVARRNKRSRRPRIQRWVQHAQARQNASSQVAVLESVVVAPPSQRSDSVPTEFPSKYLGHGWADLARVFIRTFERTCKRPTGLVELQHCVQKQNEPLRDFIQRWTTLYHTVENVTEHQAVCAFKAGVRYRDLYLKFGRTSDISMSKMMEIATRYANGEEEDRIRSGKHKAIGWIWEHWAKRKASSTPQAEAATVTNAKFKGKGKAQFTLKKKQFGNHILDQPCPIHKKMDEEGNAIFPKHTTRQCRLLIQGFGEGQPSEKDNE
ncbi:hypothetical protein ZWY2020_028262 [Hordeum vulgare]|nr:hypothetical protein ZWY2020_028262 [Hordeum vulgare]